MVSFQTEQKLAKVRPRAARLILPTLVLGLVAGALTFFENRTLEPWQTVALTAGACVLIFFAWMLPVVRQLSRQLEVTSERLVWREGLLGRKRREIHWVEVSAVEFGRGRVTVFIHEKEPLLLKALPKGKQLAREMQNLVRG